MKRYKLEVLVSKQRSHGAPLIRTVNSPLIRTVNSKLKSAGSWSREVRCLIGESDGGEQVTAAPLIALRKPGDTNRLPAAPAPPSPCPERPEKKSQKTFRKNTKA